LLLWGAADGIVTPFYGEGWRQEIAGARAASLTQLLGESSQQSIPRFRGEVAAASLKLKRQYL
jgi:hypothetical protein